MKNIFGICSISAGASGHFAIKSITKGPAQTPGQAIGFNARTLSRVLLADFQGGQGPSGKLQGARKISNKSGPADVLPQALLKRVTARNLAW